MRMLGDPIIIEEKQEEPEVVINLEDIVLKRSNVASREQTPIQEEQNEEKKEEKE